MINKTCCFTGHRTLPPQEMDCIIKRLHHEVENLIGQGVTNFISGGALGFDLLAASVIIGLRKRNCFHIKLIFALPCLTQSAPWSQEDKCYYNNLLEEANDIIYTSRHYYTGCMHVRNRYMVDHSCVCVAYL